MKKKLKILLILLALPLTAIFAGLSVTQAYAESTGESGELWHTHRQMPCPHYCFSRPHCCLGSTKQQQ